MLQVFTGISKTVKCDSSHAELRAGILELNVASLLGISKTVECGSSYTELRAGGERTCGLSANSRRKGVWKSGFEFAVCAVTLQSGCHVYRSLLTYPQWICEI